MVAEVRYSTAEPFMMAESAAVRRRKITGAERFELVTRGNVAKFGRNDALVRSG
jgi:hypothetical protein